MPRIIGEINVKLKESPRTERLLGPTFQEEASSSQHLLHSYHCILPFSFSLSLSLSISPLSLYQSVFLKLCLHFHSHQQTSSLAVSAVHLKLQKGFITGLSKSGWWSDLVRRFALKHHHRETSSFHHVMIASFFHDVTGIDWHMQAEPEVIGVWVFGW